MFAANTLVRYSYDPRYGHAKTALWALRYLKHHPKEAIKFDTQISNNFRNNFRERQIELTLERFISIYKREDPKRSTNTKRKGFKNNCWNAYWSCTWFGI